MKTLTALLVIFRTGAGLMLIVYLGSLDSPSTSVSPTIADDIVCLRRNVDGLPCLVCTRRRSWPRGATRSGSIQSRSTVTGAQRRRSTYGMRRK